MARHFPGRFRLPSFIVAVGLATLGRSEPIAAPGQQPAPTSHDSVGAASKAPSGEAKPKPAGAIRYGYEVVHTWPHDRSAFTQGLVFHDGQLLESTGLKGQ